MFDQSFILSVIKYLGYNTDGVVPKTMHSSILIKRKLSQLVYIAPNKTPKWSKIKYIVSNTLGIVRVRRMK